jgi:hypothetical protein
VHIVSQHNADPSASNDTWLHPSPRRLTGTRVPMTAPTAEARWSRGETRNLR